MMTKRIAMFTILISLLFSSAAYAHPGRTDSSGGHTCRTNCAKWGLKNGEYHYHSGGGSSSSSSSSSKSSGSSKPVDTRSEDEKKADNLIWQGDYYFKQKSYYNALHYYFQADDTGYGWKVNQGNEATAAKKVAEQAKSFYESDQLAKATQYYELLAKDGYYTSLYEVAKRVDEVNERQAFLNAFGSARWYYSQKSYINAVLLADKAMKEGLSKNTHAIAFMNEAALKLSQQAYGLFVKEDYEASLKLYNVLANAEYAPSKLKEGAAKNAIVVQRKLNEQS